MRTTLALLTICALGTFGLQAANATASQVTALEKVRELVAEGEYEQAELEARALIGEDSYEAAEALDLLVEARWRGGNAAEPETRAWGERALEIKSRERGGEDPGVATTLHHLGVVDFFLGDYDRARAEWEQAIGIRERALGKDHADVAETLNALANLLQTTGEFTLAQAHYERAVAIRERALGPEHPKVAQSLNNLASLLTAIGDFAAALPVAERSLKIKEQILGPEDPQIAASATNLADIYDQTGDRARALSLFERAAAIWEKSLGPEHRLVGFGLHNLAEQLRRDGRIEQARPLYERTIAIWEKAHGPEHSQVALALTNLGLLLESAEDLGGARALHERAVRIREEALGPEHPDLGDSLANHAGVLAKIGDHAAARPLFERAMSIQRVALGPGHPDLADSELGLARLVAREGNLARAFELALDAERIGRDHLRLTGRALAEEHALRYAAERDSGIDLALSLAIERPGSVATREIFDAVIRSRAVVLDEMAARHRSISAVASSDTARLAEQLAALRGRLANLTVRGVGDLEPETYRKLLDRTREEKELAERALGAASADFARQQEGARVGLDDVAARLPAGSALVAFVLYDHLALPAESANPPASPAPLSSYAAILLHHGKSNPDVVRLGPAEALDRRIRDWKQQVAQGVPSHRQEQADAAYREAGEALRQAAWDPLAAALASAKRVFVVPDGSLNLVSLASLPSGEGRYLIETGPTLHYLSTERDLAVAAASGVRRGTGLLALGGPDYGRSGNGAAAAREPAAVASPTRAAGCGGFAALRFDPLPAAEREAGEIVALWRRVHERPADAPDDVLFLRGAAASEAAFKRGAPGRRMLHLATHGFFLGGDCAPAARASRGIKIVEDAKPEQDVSVGPVSPLLLSGLALAGANGRAASSATEEDGVLTAEEIAGLDLTGVDWAVLSACDTGVGEIQAGEGVSGLRRAIQLAGVRTLVMSLWPVDDEATRQWMNAIYRARLEDQLDAPAAVRRAGLSVLASRREKGESTHPFYWAAFVAAGDWR